ncbi:MAG: hypothetical protein J7M26_09195 [Armatimonadetes bacterium]|nr:hypothetical protein [Armatimonadota bacterium]
MGFDRELTDLLRLHARRLGVDLIGIANVERYEHAPPLLSPQGHFPEARNIVVVALHHTDGAIEMGGRPTPHDLGPYNVQNTMNTRNEHIVWALARLLADQGWRAMPMPATNIWRFRPYDGVDRPFVPDISDIHAAAAAGLGEIGWSGLLLTPEFGPRQRFCTLITDAPLEPTPLYRGEPLCDRCMMCADHCLAEAFTKEVAGECVVLIEDREMRYANKSMWRCSWGEHYGLDLYLPKPDVITEEVILQTLAEHGRRGGEMGSCLRYCLPAHLRHEDPEYTDTVRRRLNTAPPSVAPDRPATWTAQQIAFDWGAAAIGIADAEACAAAGVELAPRLTDGQTLVAFAMTWPEGCSVPGSEGRPSAAVAPAVADFARFAAHDMARQLERLGYAAIPRTDLSPATLAQATGLGEAAPGGEVTVGDAGRRVIFGSIITSARLVPGVSTNPSPPGKDLAPLVNCLAGRRLSRAQASLAGDRCGAPEHLFRELTDRLPSALDLMGFAPAERLDELADQLEGVLDLETMAFVAVDKGGIHGPVVPQAQPRPQPILRRPSDWLDGARSVIVLGVQVPAVTLQRATEPPADGVGPWAYSVCQVRRELRYSALRIAQALAEQGYRVAVADDLMGTASAQANPRGRQPDFRSSRFAAVAAGLGHLLHTGAVWTPEYDTRAFFISLVTDAELPATPLLEGESPCEDCPRPCVAACPTAALGHDDVQVTIEGRTLNFGTLDWLRCEWAKRYGLVGDAGPRWIGSQTDLPPPEGPLTPEDVMQAYAQLDPSQKHLLCIVEPCVRACHLQLSGEARGTSGLQ